MGIDIAQTIVRSIGSACTNWHLSYDVYTLTHTQTLTHTCIYVYIYKYIGIDVAQTIVRSGVGAFAILHATSE